jgi:hypothetical protein
LKALVTITDVTRMGGQRVCIAGYLPDDTCVRLVFRWSNPTEEWLKGAEGGVIRPFAVVECDLQERDSQPPHTEDWIIDNTYRVNKGLLSPDQQEALLTRICDESVERIFGAAIHQGPGWYVKKGEGVRSLGTVKPRRVWEVFYNLNEKGKWEYRLAFSDQTGQRYKLAVTDLAFRYALDYLRVREKLSSLEAAQRLTTMLQKARVFLRIGLARPWEEFPDRCYLQITGVYSFPDYLEGRCFADLVLPLEEAR